MALSSFFLPVWLLCVAFGLEAVWGRLPQGKTRFQITGAFALVCSVAFAWFSAEQRGIIRSQSVEPVRETADAIQGIRAAHQPDEILVGALHALVAFHDPSIRTLKSAADIGLMMEESRKSGSPLFIVSTAVACHERSLPDIHALLAKSGRFSLRAGFHGLDFKHRSYQIFEYGGK